MGKKLSTQNISIEKMDSLESLERLANAIYIDKTTELSEEDIKQILWDTFILGYEVSVDGVACGWSFAKKIDWCYTLDGYNRGVSIFVASKMGKMVCSDLFNLGCDVILSMHKTNHREITALIKRIGFKELLLSGEKTIFYKVR